MKKCKVKQHYVKDILSAEDMKVNLTNESVEISLSNNDLDRVVVPFESMSALEAALLRLQYAKEVVLPGQNTAAILKQLQQDKKESK